MKKTFLLLLTLPMLLVCCRNGDNSQIEDSRSQESDTVQLSDHQIGTIGILTGKPERRQLSGTIHATGRLDLLPQDKGEVTSLVTGSARRILVKEGQAVRAGQPLALVENTEIVALQKDYIIAACRRALAQQAWQRQQNIREQGAGIEKNLEQVQAELDMAVAVENGLRMQLEQLGLNSGEVAEGKFSNTVSVRSPISGVIGEILINTGSYIDRETVLMKVYNNRALHADVNVFETDIASIHVGQKASIKLSDQTGSLVPGKVSFITATLDNNSKSASVHIGIDPQDISGLMLLPNMFVSAVIHCNEQACDAVPDEAIVMSAGRKYVFVCLDSNRFRKREVVTGLSDQGYTQITFVDEPGFNGEIVVSKAFYLESMLSDHGED